MTSRTVDPIYVPLTVLCPKGTTAAAPLITAVPVEHGILEEVRLQIPPGHVGVTGIRFLLSGQQFLPWSNTVSWIIGDDRRDPFEVGVEVDNKLTVATFNLGNYDHSFLLLFKLRQMETVRSTPVLRLIDAKKLSSAG